MELYSCHTAAAPGNAVKAVGHLFVEAGPRKDSELLHQKCGGNIHVCPFENSVRYTALYGQREGEYFYFYFEPF
jgi:hypothetical protein